jgi:hypothetical protein
LTELKNRAYELETASSNITIEKEEECFAEGTLVRKKNVNGEIKTVKIEDIMQDDLIECYKDGQNLYMQALII